MRERIAQQKLKKNTQPNTHATGFMLAFKTIPRYLYMYIRDPTLFLYENITVKPGSFIVVNEVLLKASKLVLNSSWKAKSLPASSVRSTCLKLQFKTYNKTTKITKLF